MPSKDPAVIKRAQERYRRSAHGRAKRKAAKAVWDKNNKDKKAVNDRKWRRTPAYKAIAAKKARERKFKRKQWLYDIKSKLSCSECGYDKHPVALQFHHVNESTKLGEINRLLYRTNANLSVILAEMKKCVVLCANCHAVHHYEEYYKTVELRPDAV
jgi:hypothetical protein